MTPAATPTWTPLATAIPPRDGPYLVRLGDSAAVAHWAYGGGWVDLLGPLAAEVTHWMPLPPPPPPPPAAPDQEDIP